MTFLVEEMLLSGSYFDVRFRLWKITYSIIICYAFTQIVEQGIGRNIVLTLKTVIVVGRNTDLVFVVQLIIESPIYKIKNWPRIANSICF